MPNKSKIIKTIKKIKNGIEEHIKKLEKTLTDKNYGLAFYYYKEFKRKFFPLLIKKYEQLKEDGKSIIKIYEEKVHNILQKHNALNIEDNFKMKFEM